MSDKTQDAVAEMKAAAELKPVIDGVKAIADQVTTSEKRLTDKIEEIDKKTARAVEDLEDKTNKGLEDTLEAIGRLKNRSSAFDKALGIVPGDDVLKGVLSPEIKEKAREFEMLASRMPEGLSVRDAGVCMATTEWLTHSTKAQLPKFAGRAAEHAEKADKLYAAMQEHAGVTKANPLQEDTDGEGGYLVPTIVEGDVHRLITDHAQIWPLCRQMAMRSKTHTVPTEATAVTVNWISEEGALTGGEPVFGQVSIEAEKLAGRATLSLELLQDSSVSLLPWLLQVFAEKMAGELDYQVILGDGTTTELLGVMNGTGINAVTDSTQTSLTWSHLVNCFVGASEQSARDDGVWIMSKRGFAEVLKLSDTAGNPIVQYGITTREAPTPTLLGRPIITSARVTGNLTLDQVTLTKTDILFGPPQTFTAGTRLGMMWDVTDQVGWANYRADCRLVGRFGGRPTVPAAWSYVEVSYS